MSQKIQGVLGQNGDTISWSMLPFATHHHRTVAPIEETERDLMENLGTAIGLEEVLRRLNTMENDARECESKYRVMQTNIDLFKWWLQRLPKMVQEKQKPAVETSSRVIETGTAEKLIENELTGLLANFGSNWSSTRPVSDYWVDEIHLIYNRVGELTTLSGMNCMFVASDVKNVLRLFGKEIDYAGGLFFSFSPFITKIKNLVGVNVSGKLKGTVLEDSVFRPKGKENEDPEHLFPPLKNSDPPVRATLAERFADHKNTTKKEFEKNTLQTPLEELSGFVTNFNSDVEIESLKAQIKNLTKELAVVMDEKKDLARNLRYFRQRVSGGALGGYSKGNNNET